MSTSTPAPLPLRTRAALFTQLAALENAGLPAARAFAMLELEGEAQSRIAQTQQLLARRGDIAAAGESSGLFTKLDARLIRAALLAGSPGTMYRRLAEVYTQRAAQSATVKSRLLLPAFLFLAALLIGPLPGFITGTIGMGAYAWKILRPLLLTGVLILLGRQLLPYLPPFNRINARRNRRDFFESLALMLEAGIPMLEALPAARDIIDDAGIKREFASIAPRIAKGATLAQALAALPRGEDAHLVSFVETGEQSGTLPEMLFRHVALETNSINDFYAQLAVWAPRLVYGLVVLWMAYSLVSGPGMAPQLPAELR
ncbi:MAG TPA: type II secretion system F family protein [Usitatibacteraceae bacterium]